VPSVKTRGVLNVPERYRSGFSVIARMSDASFNEIASALERAPAFTSAKELSTWVVPEAKSTPAAEAAQIVEALTSLYRVRLRLETSPERIAKDVVGSLQEENDPDVPITEQNRKAIADRLAKLLGMESLNVVQTKAQELKGEYEHEFCDARIFTDLRPVFRSNVADAPETMLLVHMLKLGYHDAHEGRHREFYVSLDADDLSSLKAAIERAETKAKSIKSRLDLAGLKLIDLA
jgi:hypothetical protein